jgi:futalosine hydrolase
MKVLVVSATQLELAPTLKRLGVSFSSASAGAVASVALGDVAQCDFLITGVGQFLCGVQLVQHLSAYSYDFVVHVGIAGSFTENVPKRSRVVVSREVFGDLGAEDNGSFLSIQQMGLLAPDEPPFKDGALHAPEVSLASLRDIPRVLSVTVNRVLSEERSIEWIRSTFSPSVVHMEGAALFYVLLARNVPFVSLRTISDLVGPRNKSSWDIAGAVSELNELLAEVLAELVKLSAENTAS